LNKENPYRAQASPTEFELRETEEEGEEEVDDEVSHEEVEPRMPLRASLSDVK
jgi:hypothetical protein